MFAAHSAESAATTQQPEAYRYPRPIWRVLVGGQDVTGKVAPRLQSLTITECRSDQADQLDLVLDDHDGRLELPARGVSVRVLLGWESTGLVDKGTFEVDEVEFSGPPDVITLRARSADMKSALRTRSARSFHGTTIKAIVETIAKAHDLTAVVGTFGNTKVQHIDQTDESDLAFLNRIGKRYDAVATVRALYFQCRALFCGHTWKSHLEMVCTVTPSAVARPSINIPISPKSENLRLLSASKADPRQQSMFGDNDE